MLVLLLVTGLRVTPHVCIAACSDHNQTLLCTMHQCCQLCKPRCNPISGRTDVLSNCINPRSLRRHHTRFERDSRQSVCQLCSRCMSDLSVLSMLMHIASSEAYARVRCEVRPVH